MTDEVNALAAEYFDYLLQAWPTWGHIMGNYQHADRFDDASRAGEDEEIAARRSFADRAEAIPGDGLSAQEARRVRDALAQAEVFCCAVTWAVTVPSAASV